MEREAARFSADSMVFSFPLNFLVTKENKSHKSFKKGSSEKLAELLLKEVHPGNLERGEKRDKLLKKHDLNFNSNV